MTKADLVAKLNGCGFTVRQGEVAVEAMLESITEALKNGDKVVLSGIGTLETVKTKERTMVGLNKKKFTVKSKTKIKFKQSKNFEVKPTAVSRIVLDLSD